MWEFAKGNTFGANVDVQAAIYCPGAFAFGSYGGFWLSFWYLVAHSDRTGAGTDVAKGVGFFLPGWTIFTVYMFVCALNINGMLFAALGFLTLTFLF